MSDLKDARRMLTGLDNPAAIAMIAELPLHNSEGVEVGRHKSVKIIDWPDAHAALEVTMSTTRVSISTAEPCQCGTRLAEPGDTCVTCGRYSALDLIGAALGWHDELREDETLRRLRRTEDE